MHERVALSVEVHRGHVEALAQLARLGVPQPHPVAEAQRVGGPAHHRGLHLARALQRGEPQSRRRPRHRQPVGHIGAAQIEERHDGHRIRRRQPQRVQWQPGPKALGVGVQMHIAHAQGGNRSGDGRQIHRHHTGGVRGGPAQHVARIGDRVVVAQDRTEIVQHQESRPAIAGGQQDRRVGLIRQRFPLVVTPLSMEPVQPSQRRKLQWPEGVATKSSRACGHSIQATRRGVLHGRLMLASRVCT